MSEISTNLVLEPRDYCIHQFFEVPQLIEDYANYTAVRCVNCGTKRLLSMKDELRWNEKTELWEQS